MTGTAEISKNRTAAHKILMIETVVVLLCGLALYKVISIVAAYSVILGGAAAIIPNAIFVRFSLRESATSVSRNILTLFYIGETVKIVTTISIFLVSLILFASLNIGLMFITYGVVLLINLAGLAILTK